jgi:hypothetical protein
LKLRSGVRTDDASQDELDAIENEIKENDKSLEILDTLILQDIQNNAAVPHTIWDYVTWIIFPHSAGLACTSRFVAGVDG